MGNNDLEYKKLISTIKPLHHDKVNHYIPPKKITCVTHINCENDDIAQVSANESINYSRQSLPKKLLKKFKQGTLDLDDTIDLHGLTKKQAQRYLADFIEESLQANHFIVGVIHGKSHNNAQAPILKNFVYRWLRQQSSVIAICSAPTADGGTGKVYVMLEKTR